MLLNQRQRRLTLRTLMLAVLLMQLMPVSHALHGPFEHSGGDQHSEAHQDHDCDDHDHANHHSSDSDHGHSDHMLMECDCLLCQMAKSPALAPLLWLGTQPTVTASYAATKTPLAAGAAFYAQPPVRGPPLTFSIG